MVTEPFEGRQSEIALLQGKLIDAKGVAMFERAARVDEARCLVELWAWVVEVEIRDDLLEVELTCTLENQRGVSTSLKRATGDDSRSPASSRVWGPF